MCQVFLCYNLRQRGEIWLSHNVDGWLRLFDPEAGRLLPTPAELADEVERLRAELAQLKGSNN